MSRHRAPEASEASEQPENTAEPELQPESQSEPPSEPQLDRPRPRPRPASAPGATAAPARPFWQRGPVLLVAAVVLTALAIAAAVVAIRRDDSPAAARTTAPTTSGAGLTSPAAAQAFVAGALAGVTAVTAYDYRSLDVALTSGLAVTTGTYREAYRRAIGGDLGRTARAQRVVQTFEQSAAGIGTMAADGQTAKVLVFGVQSVTRGTGAPVSTPVTLTATIVRQGSRYLISRLDADANAGLPPGTPQLSVAAETARRATVESLTLRRASLASDYAAALADTVDPRRADLVTTLASARRAVERGDYDLTGRVTAIAVERVVPNAVAVLVAATGLRTSGGTSSVLADARLRVTLVRTSAGWRVSDTQPVTG